MPYPVPGGEARAEIEVLGSRFIASIAPAHSVEQARAFVERIKLEFASASHNVAAYLVGHGSTVVAHCNDAGEPAGTAGRPALAVLRGSGLGDVVVVVSRYFGGIKLGTGGLVRAYGDAVRAVLEIVSRAERVPTCTIRLVVPYALLEPVRSVLKPARSTRSPNLLAAEYASEVTLTARLPAANLAEIQSALQELSNGTLQAEVVEYDEGTVLPLESPDG